MSDALLAVVLLLGGLYQVFYTGTPKDSRGADWREALVLTGLSLVLVARRRSPLTVLAASVAGCLLLGLLDYPLTATSVLVYLVATYSVAAHRPLSVSSAGGVLALAGFATIAATMPSRDDTDTSGAAGYVLDVALIVGVWWLGRSMRLRRAYEVELTYRAERLERARDLDARAARVEERSRIARELHDVVAHHVSVMTVQAGAARRIIDKSPDTAREAMATIEETGRSALSEMRRIVGVLRTERDGERDPVALAPQPGVHEIGELVDHIRETGLSVQLWVDGDPRPLPPGVNLAAYRLIQEALTNTLKHAGPQARAWVRVHYAALELIVQVEDDGRGVAAALATDDRPGGTSAAGHGMVGMHERVALYGGQLRIGPRVGGGFEVRARFPLD